MKILQTFHIRQQSLFKSNMQQSRQAKQQFLRTQILQKGYDPDQFVDYLNQVSTKGADVDLLTLKQLQSVTKAFIDKKSGQVDNQPNKKHDNTKQKKTQQTKILQKQNQQKIKIVEQKNKFIIYEKYGNPPPIQQMQYQKTFKCIKSSAKPKAHICKIEVSDPKRQTTGGIFGFGAVSFLMFKIITPDFKWEVRRRYSDFQWLRQTICKFFPTFIIPPIPRKNAAKRTARDLQKRMRILTHFLNDIWSMPIIFNNKYVQGFLSINSQSKFQQLKEEANKKQIFQGINTLQTQSGDITIKLTTQRKVYLQEMQKFLSRAQVLYKDITRNSKQLQNHMIEQTNTLYSMGNQFADLHELISGINNRLPNSQQPLLNDTYITLNNMMVQWGNIVRNQHAYLEKNFNTFFRYIRNELYSFRQLLQKVSSFQQQYFQKKIIIDKKKQKIFSLNDITKWELPYNQIKNIPTALLKNKSEAWNVMLPKQSQQLQKYRTNFVFYASQFYQNSNQTLTRGSTRFCENFKEFAIKIKVNNQQLTELWTEIATNFADPKRKALTIQPIINKQQQIFDV